MPLPPSFGGSLGPGRSLAHTGSFCPPLYSPCRGFWLVVIIIGTICRQQSLHHSIRLRLQLIPCIASWGGISNLPGCIIITTGRRCTRLIIIGAVSLEK